MSLVFLLMGCIVVIRYSVLEPTVQSWMISLKDLQLWFYYKHSYCETNSHKSGKSWGFSRLNCSIVQYDSPCCCGPVSSDLLLSGWLLAQYYRLQLWCSEEKTICQGCFIFFLNCHSVSVTSCMTWSTLCRLTQLVSKTDSQQHLWTPLRFPVAPAGSRALTRMADVPKFSFLTFSTKHSGNAAKKTSEDIL